MATSKETLKLYIHEQQRYHDELTISNASIKNRILTYISVTLALLVFLYSDSLRPGESTLGRLFIPPALYGKIFYAAGLFLILYALGKLLHASKPGATWMVAVESKDCKKVESMSELEYLVKLKDDYETARSVNISQNNKRNDALKEAFFPLVLGAIILIVLRYFQ